MPRAPSYNPATSGAAPVQARLQAPAVVQSGLAQGLDRLSETVTGIDKMQAQYDDTLARKQALALKPQFDEAIAQFKAVEGTNAVEQRQALIDQLGKLRDQGVAQLKSPRSQQFFSEHFGAVYSAAVGEIDSHAFKQAAVARKGVLGAELSDAQDMAAGLVDNPQELAAAVGIVGQKAQAYADFAGLGEATGHYVKEQQGAVYGMAIERLVKDNKVDLAAAIFDAHNDGMTFEQRNRALDMLREPMKRREADSIVDAAMAGLTANPNAQQPGSGGPATETVQLPIANPTITNNFAQHVKRKSAGVDYAGPLGAAIHPMAGGTVTNVTQDGKSGRWVEVKHPDGSRTTYSHMGNQSVKVGDAVTPETVLGTIGMTGHTTGPHVHVRMYDKNGRDVDPESVVGRRAGRPAVIGSTDAARNYDQAAVISNIKAMGLDPETEAQAIDRARDRMREAESLLEDRYQDAADELHQWIGNYQVSHNGEDPPPSAIPSSIASKVKPSMLAEMRGNLAKAQKAKYDEAARREQENTALGLKLQSYLQPDKFVQTDLRQFQGSVPFSDLSGLLESQAKARAAAGQWSSASASASALDTFDRRNPGLLPRNPGVKDPKGMAEYNRRRLAILDTVSQFAEAIAAKGTIPTEAQLQQAVAQATKEIRFASGNTGRVYDIQFENLSPQTVQTIRNNLRLRRVANPSNDEILREYRRTARDSQGN